MEDSLRSDKHKKNDDLENIFPEMEKYLGYAENLILKDYIKPEKKAVFIVGCARSGTTLLYQYLANTGFFSYPSNLISRFYYAPYIGARIQQLLLDYDYKHEIFPELKNQQVKYHSTLGKTFGPSQPHEFWYFWNRFFEFDHYQKLLSADWNLFLKELHAFEQVYNKPILMKAMNMNFSLSEFHRNFENTFFIYVKRDVASNAASLLKARLEYFGNEKEWYSFKVPNFNEIVQLKPEYQVIQQVRDTNQLIEDQLSEIPDSAYCTINYSEFCKVPKTSISEVLEPVLPGITPYLEDKEFKERKMPNA